MGYVRCDESGCVRHCVVFENGVKKIIECSRRSEIVAGVCICYAEPRRGEYDVIEPEDHNNMVDIARALVRMLEEIASVLTS